MINMSEELTKLAKLANSAAGDSDLELKLNTSLASPKMRALHLKDEIGPLGPPGPPGPPPGGMKMEEKVPPMKMELGSKNSQGMMRLDHMKGGGGGLDMKVDGVAAVMKKEEDDAVFLRDGQMNQVNSQMNNQMMSNGPQDDKGMNMLHRQVGGYPHPPNFTMQDSQHIYTFSTLLANRAAQAVYTGQTDSILAYHRVQSCKRKFLDPEEDTGAAPNHSGNTGPGTPQQNNTPQAVDGTTVQSANGQNGKPGTIDSSMDGARKSIDSLKGKNPGTPQSVQEGVEGSDNSRKTPLESGTGGGGTTTTKGNKKRKRPNSSSQPLQANLQGGGPGGPMQQGMPPSGPSFGPYGPGAYRPGFPPQNLQMRPPMSSQSFHNQPSTTETENLDPSALWENPPNVKKTMTTTMAPSFPPDMSPMRMASPNPAMRSPSAGLVLGNENMVPPSGPQGPRPFMSPSHPSQSLPASPVNPYDMPNYKPPQQIDNPTPEQLRHRQERLRTLKEMQKLLFPEEHGSMSPSPGRMMSPIGMPPPPQDPMAQQPQGMMSPGGGPMMRPMGPSGPMMGPGGPGGPHPMMHQGMGPGMHPRMPAQDGMRGMSPDQRMMMANSGMMMPPLPPDWENMSPAQREWYKLQQEFYLDKRRKIMEDQAKMQGRISEFPPGAIGPGHGPGPMRGEPMMSPHHPGSGGFPGDVMGMNMGPPPPYPAGPGPGQMSGGPPGPGPVPGPPSHGMQRRASMSGPMPPMGPGGPGPGMVGGPGGPGVPGGPGGPGGPPGPGGMGSQNAPFPMSPHMPSPRTNRSSSVPGMQSGSSQPPMTAGPGAMNSGNMPPGPQPGPGPVSSASSMSMANTMSPHAPVGSPMKSVYRAPTPTSANTSANQPPQQNTDPIMSSMVRTPGSVGPVEQSPRPNQPGTPAAMDNPVVLPNVSSVNTPNTSQPGTPNSVINNTMSTSSVLPPTTAHSNGSQSSTTGGNSNVTNAPPPATSNITSAPTPTSSAGSTNTTAGNAADSGKPMDVQSQQRLVNFPPSQLNRDKAPNFPPRGEDLQQYASTFYQKTVNKEPPMKGPGRLQHFGSPPMNSPINTDMPTIGSPSSGIMSPGVMMTSQSGMMPPGGMPAQSGMMPHGMEGGQGPPPAQQGGPIMGPGHSPSGPAMSGGGAGPPASSAMMNPRMAAPQQSMHSPMMQGQGPMMSSARMQQPGGMMSPQNSMMPHNLPPQSGMMSPTMGPVDMMGPQGIPMSREQRMIMSQSRMMSQGHPMMEGGPGPMPGGPGMMGPHPMERGMMQGMNNFEPGMNPGMHPNMMRFSGPRGMPSSGFMEGGGMPSGPGRTSMPHPGMMGMGMGQGGPEMGVMGGMERNMGPATSGGQANSPLSLLQSRFSPPLLPDGKGPKQTLQYFPANTNQGSGQGQSGNPHVNPGTGPSPGQGPKQIELPFPVEMVTGGMNPGSMNPSFSRGPGPGAMGPGPRMSPMMNQEMMMHQGYGMGPGGGPNPGPRGQVPGPNPMGYMGPRGMPGYGGMNPGGPMGPGGPPYGDPNFGPMGPDPMGPGFNMPK